MVSVNGDAYGRYERNEVRPTIEMALKIANILGVALDYLAGNTDMELDTKMLNRIIEVQNLPEEVQEKVFYFLDMFIWDFKAQSAYAS